MSMSVEDELAVAEMTGDENTVQKILEYDDEYVESSENFANLNNLYDPNEFNNIMAAFDEVIVAYGYEEVESTSVEAKAIKNYSQEESNLNMKNVLESIKNNENLIEEEKEQAIKNIEIVTNALNKTENSLDSLDDDKVNQVMTKSETIIEGLNKNYNLNIDFNELVKNAKNLDTKEFNNDLDEIRKDIDNDKNFTIEKEDNNDLGL